MLLIFKCVDLPHSFWDNTHTRQLQQLRDPGDGSFSPWVWWVPEIPFVCKQTLCGSIAKPWRSRWSCGGSTSRTCLSCATAFQWPWFWAWARPAWGSSRPPSSAAGPSMLWRLGVGSTLCLLALLVLMKQLLSSAVQDMGCIHSRRRIEQLRSGGTVDPVLLLFTGFALLVCGTTLLCLTQLDMLLSGVTLLASGSAVVLGVMVYGVKVYVQGRRITRRRRQRRLRVYTVTGQRNRPWRESASSQSNLVWKKNRYFHLALVPTWY